MKFLSCTIAYGMIFPVVLLAQQTPNEGLSLRADGKSASRLLVTNSGRIVAGELLPRPGGYDVILSAGRMFIDSEQVRFLADSPDDAYQKMRESLGELTPDSHLTLARWCLANGQVHNAKREILDALHLDPWRSDAKLMLEKLVRQQQVVVTSGTSNAATIENLSESPSAELNLSDSLLMKPERRSLGGLPADDAKMFTQSVQRILISRCGNARCHGGTSNEMTFRLVPLRNGSSPALAEQNLAAVLNQIDPSAPLQSPLLKACDGLHGGMSQLIFQGQTGRIQTETLRTWVQKIASE
ncbi:MAG: hypothetical protein KDA81_08315, partial [Planctomycetaceae bacterium]|nr:hypothetical protein [Planctomycetaceae bacterium]